jgi:hypothetical protein
MGDRLQKIAASAVDVGERDEGAAEVVTATDEGPAS